VSRSINYSPAQTTALNQLIKRIPRNAGSGASSPCSFAHNDAFSSLMGDCRIHCMGFCFDRLIARVFSFGREVQFFVRQFASGFGSNGEVSGVSAGKVRVLPYCRG